MRASLGTAGAIMLEGRARGDEPADDSDPAPLIARMGPMMAKIPIKVVGLAADFHLIQHDRGAIHQVPVSGRLLGR